MMKSNNKPKLIIRNALESDLNSIQKLYKLVYPGMPTYSDDVIRGQINNFPEGQFVAVYEEKIVGYCATIIVRKDLALQKHSWREATGGGYGATHDKNGEYLYGMEIFVDRNFRGLRIGQRFYREREKLCKNLNLKGVVFAGRLPYFHKHVKKVKTPENYCKLVQEKKIKDPVLSFQLREGFEMLGVIENYLPSDFESLGCAAHLIWRNPELPPESTSKSNSTKKASKIVRVATVQYQQRRIKSFSEFEQIVTYFVDVVADYKSDFILFPELFTLQLLSIENDKISPEASLNKLTEYTERIKSLFNDLSIKFNLNVIAGSHPTKSSNGEIQNISYIFLRDGSVHQQIKIHPTPSERYWWNIKGGNQLSVISTDCGPIGVLICYDSEFPELARHLINQGANILFVPFCTDVREAYLRVRYSAQARAIENQCYVVLSGNVGNLPRVHNMDIQYAQSCILTPCDFLFSRDGIAVDTTPNTETVAFADLNMENLVFARNTGSVLSLKDRRHDLYSVVWHGE